MELFGGKKDSRHSAPQHASPGSDKDKKDIPQESAAQASGKSGKGGVLRGVFAAVIVVCVIAAAAYVGWNLWIKEPDIGQPGTPPPPVSAPPSGSPAPPETTGTPDPGTDDGVVAEAPDIIDAANRREGVYTFALMGLDVVGNNMDVIVVGMFDTVEGKLNLVTIPRDTLLNIGYEIKKPNYIYPACVNNGKDGIQPTLDALADMLGYHPDCYAVVDTAAVEQLVDAVGGVRFNVPRDMYYNGWDQKPPIYIDIKKGEQLLNGADFVKVARFRYTMDRTTGTIIGGYTGGDVDRIKTQHDLLMALMHQLLDLGNIPNLREFIRIYEDNVTTNLTARNLGFFANEFLKLDFKNITFNTMPGNPDIFLYKISYVSPYIDEWLEMVNEYLNPFTVEITTSNVDMLSFDGNNFYATMGRIRGGEYSFYGSQA